MTPFGSRYAADLTENREIYISLYSTPPSGGPRRNLAKMFSFGKTRMIGQPYAEESMIDMLSRFDTIPERDRQTDGEDRYINIACQHRSADAR